MIMRSKLKDAKRIVIKIGTSSLTYSNGKLNLKQIEQLANIVSDLMNAGKQIILVSSGAIGAGMGVLNIKQKPLDIAMKQATAAVGQAYLMQIYQRYFSQNTQIVAQVLLTKDVLEQSITRQNVERTLNQLFAMQVVPIINENDTVSTNEIMGLVFSDNDQLSSTVSIVTEADLLIILTTTDGLLDKQKKLVNEVVCVDDTIRGYVETGKTTLGTGGMKTKLDSIAEAMQHGVSAVICNSNDLNNLYKVLAGETVGTFFKGVK